MLVCSIALALGGGVREAGAAFPGTNGRIVYASDRDTGTGEPAELFTIDPDGTGRVQLTTTPGDESGPVWSADGSRIAFARGGDLFVINSDGSGETNVTSSAGSSELEPAWSPDGTKLVFRRVNELFSIGVDGTGELQLTDYPEFFSTSDFQPAWSPDGTKIVFASTRDDQFLFRSDLYVMNADGTAETRLTNSAGQDDLAPSWSPDGARIVWAHQPDPGPNQTDILVMNADGTSPVNLTSSGEIDADPAWSPDGTSIVFRLEDVLWTVAPDGTGLAQLTSGVVPTETSDREPDWGVAAAPARTLTVSKAGVGDGSVSSAPAGISCGVDCSESYASGTSVTLTAAAASGSTFGSWSGCDSVSGAQCTVALTSNRGVTASFAATPPPTPVPEPPPASPPGGADLRLTLTGSAVQVGENAVVRARLVNVGPSAATVVRLEGFLPAQTFAVTPSAGTCELTAGRLGCTFGTLAPGDSVEVAISLFSESAGRVPLALSVASATADPAPGNNVAETTVDFSPASPPATADLRVELAGPASGAAGAVVAFSGRVANGGPATSASVSLRGIVTNGLRLLTASTERGACAIVVDVSCDLGALAAGADVRFEVTAQLPRTVVFPLDLRPTLAVTVAGAVLDPVAANDTAAAKVQTLTPLACLCAKLKVQMTADLVAVTVGELVTFRTTVSTTDAGWGPFPGKVPFTLLNELPAGADLVSATSPAGTCTAAPGRVSCGLDPRTDAPLRVDVVVRVRAPGGIVNRAAVVPFPSLDPASDARAELALGECGVLGTEKADLLRGRFAGDVVCGLDGADEVSMPLGGLVRMDGGADLLDAVGPTRADGGAGNDTLLGSDGPDVLAGGDGADRLEGRRGADRLEGGPGDDVLLPGQQGLAADSVAGGPGNDVIRVLEAAGPALTRADGGAGQDELVGRSFARLAGGDGADRLVDLGGGVSLILEGGAGPDRITGGAVALAGGFSASGGDGNDMLVGDARAQLLLGGDGADVIEARGGNDEVTGGPGDDVLDGGAGSDVIAAGAGNDTVDGDGTATRGQPIPVGDDAIDGGQGNDLLRGGLGRDTIDGDVGNDTIEGGGGSNTLRSGDGNDRIEGGPLADLLEGGAGNDWLEGGGASDLVLGGPGDDHMRGNDGIDRLVGGPGRDTILPGNQADVVEAIDGERDILQCAASPAVVDGPFLADEVDLSTNCRSLVYDFKLATYNRHATGICVFSAARTSATLVYSIQVSGPYRPLYSVTMHGSPGNVDRHRHLTIFDSDSSQNQAVEVKLVVEREGLTATHVNRTTIFGWDYWEEGCRPG